MPGSAPLRVVLCTCGGLHGALVLDALLDEPAVQLAGVVRSTRVHGPRDGFVSGALRHAARSGAGYTGYLWASTGLADAALAFSGAGSVATRAKRAGVPVISTRRVNEPRVREALAEIAPDLLVSAFFNQRIGAEVAGLPRLGAVNIHPSSLPADRGVDPVFRAASRGAAALGVSVHRVVPRLDEGDVIAAGTLAALPGESVFSATARLYAAGARLLAAWIGEGASAPARPQACGGSYDSWPSRADVAALRSRGARLVALDDFARIRSRGLKPWRAGR